ncbi:MAG: dTDP-4-dehydrorhamnose reductase [Alphaproteobacteria bacterium]|nr:dTDP-4-dehydrorhamnose reductase [Alphaproteobacteria bacterium]
MLLITGSSGQLGSELKKFYSSEDTFFTTHSSLNISDISVVRQFCKDHAITAIINCAAYTAVDDAESNRDACFQVNAEGVSNLSKISSEFNIPLVHISTDYVFNGNNSIPYKESDKIDPKSVYALSKLKGEEAFLKYAKNGIIIRTSWLYSEFGNNFLKTILRLSNERDVLNIVCDQIGTPTYAYDLAKFLHNVLPRISEHTKDIYHFSNEGTASWCDFAREIISLKKLNCDINPIGTKEYPLPAQRPSYSVLSKKKIKEDFDIEIRHWKEALLECIKRIS